MPHPSLLCALDDRSPAWEIPNSSTPHIMIRTTPKSKLELLPEGIIHNTYTEGSLIDKEEASIIITTVNDMIGGKRLLLLNDLRTKVTFNREARNHFRDNTKADSSVAFIINSKIGEVAVNFFLKFNAPHYNLRVFHDIDEGRAWLEREAKHVTKA